MAPPLRVAVYAAYPMVIAGLRQILESAGFETVDDVGIGEAVLPANNVDVLVADLGGAGHEDLLAALGEELATLPAVLLVDPASRARVPAGAGAPRSRLLRDVSDRELRLAIEATAAGLVVESPELARAIEDSVPPQPVSDVTLTQREAQVLQLLATGLPNKTIAHRLAISENTVKFHVAALLSKLDARSRTEAVTVAARSGLLSL